MRSAIWGRRRAVLAAGGLALLLSAASAAFACTSTDGFTWYSDGTTSKSGSNGSAVTVYATGAMHSAGYYMISGQNANDGMPCIGNWVKENPNVRTSSSSGLISNTSGTIDRGTGTWQVCFVTQNIETAPHPTSMTSYVSFQVI